LPGFVTFRPLFGLEATAVFALVSCLRADEGDVYSHHGMDSDEREDWTSGELVVVVNEEEQYSIWPADRTIPAGWREAGKRGNKAECLAYIEEVWTDMRPASLRRALEADRTE